MTKISATRIHLERTIRTAQAHGFALEPDEQRLARAIKEYRNRRCQPSRALKEFLSFFAYRSFDFQTRGHGDVVSFNISKTLKRCPDYYLKGMERAFGMEPLIPIGLAYTEHMILFCSREDWTYGCYDDLVILFGHTPFEALENILADKELERRGG